MTTTAAIGRVGVVGAGTMGTGIAAHLANAGADVVLLDAIPGGAERAVATAARARPSPFMAADGPRRIACGDFPADAPRLATCDWIIEAVSEDVAVKRAVLATIARDRRPAAIVSSNTSSIPLAELAPDEPRAAITHFFNPPRWNRLVELVTGPAADADVAETLAAFADERLGKTVIRCADTPGFVANRLGSAWIGHATAEAVRRGVPVERADAAIARLFGVPRTGVFGLLDLVGVDVSLAVARSYAQRLAPDDPLLAIERPWALLEQMTADGRTGRKAGAGFYGEAADGTRLALDLGGAGYRPWTPAPPDDAVADDYARAVLDATLAYAATLVPAVARSPEDVDLAMEAGYLWRTGPFALADERAGRPRRRPAPAPGALRLGDPGTTAAARSRDDRIAVWDLGDGIRCAELLDAVDDRAIRSIARAAAGGCRALVVYREGRNFAAAGDAGDDAVRAAIGAAPVPIVAAPAGTTRGGGLALVRAATAVQAHAELVIGPDADGVVSTSAAHARALGLLDGRCGITMNRARLLADARTRALAEVRR